LIQAFAILFVDLVASPFVDLAAFPFVDLAAFPSVDLAAFPSVDLAAFPSVAMAVDFANLALASALAFVLHLPTVAFLMADMVASPLLAMTAFLVDMVAFPLTASLVDMVALPLAELAVVHLVAIPLMGLFV
jgi:hypothetical protein